MRVRNFNTESNAFTADITFCHKSAPPSTYFGLTNVVILTDIADKIKPFIEKNSFFSLFLKNLKIAPLYFYQIIDIMLITEKMLAGHILWSKK